MYTLIFMFKPGIKVARLDPRSHLVILRSQAGSAALQLYLGDIFLTSPSQPKVFLDIYLSRS